MDDAASGVRAWLEGKVPAEWSAQPPLVAVDRDEISVVLALREAFVLEGQRISVTTSVGVSAIDPISEPDTERRWNATAGGQ